MTIFELFCLLYIALNQNNDIVSIIEECEKFNIAGSIESVESYL